MKRFTKVVEEVWTGEWDLDEVPDFRDLFVEATDGGVGEKGFRGR